VKKNNSVLYPLHFIPIGKEKLWGGNKLKQFLKKPFNNNAIGESWEISAVPKNISIVSNGDLKGNSLTELVTTFKEKLVGKKVYQQFKNEFPLLIKFIDAKKDLSIQVHPNDELSKNRHNSFGKNEMWYIINAKKNAELIMGFNKKQTPESFQKHLENNDLEKNLNYKKVAKGDVFFIPTGKIHAIGKGILLAEIQQTSDITYRIYDWNRKNKNGKKRKLHTSLALDAIDYNSSKNNALFYKTKNNHLEKIIKTPYFNIKNIIVNSENLAIVNTKQNSFFIYICVLGKEVTYSYNHINGKLSFGQTMLVPACIKKIVFCGKNTKLLQVSID